MISAGEFGGKYAVGKMAEIMIASNEAIFKMREEVYNASRELLAMKEIPASEWLKVFMYISNYMRVLRPIARGDWDEPEKFVQRQTLTLDGPYPGISSDLIALVDNKPSAVSHFDNIGRKLSSNSVPDERTSIKIKNLELRGLGDDQKEYLFKTSSCPQRHSKYDQRVICDCLKVVHRSPSSSEIRRKLHLVEKIQPKYYPRYNYCEE